MKYDLAHGQSMFKVQWCQTVKLSNCQGGVKEKKKNSKFVPLVNSRSSALIRKESNNGVVVNRRSSYCKLDS